MRKLLFSILVLSGFLAQAAQDTLSKSAVISVITMGPSQEQLYTAFGHSAVRVFDPEQGLDFAFNWGVFDFDQPNFYLNFARGRNMYMLGIYPYGLFRDHYISRNSYVHEQKLNLTRHQKQRLYDYLVWNSREENRSYPYDYFYDNCATRVRDVMVKVFGDSINYDISYIGTDYTIRDLTDIYLRHQPWGDLGIDICLGLPMDKQAAPLEYMFLPDYVEFSFDRATINGKRLVEKRIDVYESQEEEHSRSLFHPLNVFVLFLLIAIALSVWDVNRKKLSTWFDAIIFGTTGAVGLLLLLLWVATDHKAAANNFNLLWALPTNLIAAIAFYKNPTWLKKYFLVVTIIVAATLALWAVLPQDLNDYLIPVVIAIGLRAFVQYRLR